VSTGTPAIDAPDEVQSILAWLDEKPTIARHVSAVRRLEQARDARPDRFADAKLLFVRNFTIEPIEPLLKIAAYRADLHVDVAYSGYDPAPGPELEGLLDTGPDAVVIALRLEELAPVLTDRSKAPDAVDRAAMAEDVIDRVLGLARLVRKGCDGSIFVQNFASPAMPAAGLADTQSTAGELNLVRHMNVRLAERVGEIDGAFIVDIDHVLARIGLTNAYDERGDHVAGAPFTQDALRALAGAYVRHIRAASGPAVKCVVLDCDNTLWGGVVGEDGLEGIVLDDTGPGRRFTDLQKDLIVLRDRGIVLAICSKNEHDDVLDVLRNHPNTVLREDDFAAMRINWDDKAENITSIADELNLGLEHLVFVDDSDVECGWVSGRLRAVRVIQWPPPSSQGPRISDLPIFDSLVVTEEDRRRTEMYRSEAKRREARGDDLSLDDYLRSLEMIATVGTATSVELPRLAQLCQRTNQFNLTTRRHGAAELQQFASDPDSSVLWLDLADRFGSNGIVGCAVLRRSADDAVIDTLLLSCRVIGRGAESVLVNRLAIIAREMGAKTLIGEYIPSKRNGQVAELYARLGFDPADSGGEPGRFWTWDLANGVPTDSAHIRTIDRWRDPS
jgi:FkbH-like protein